MMLITLQFGETILPPCTLISPKPLLEDKDLLRWYLKNGLTLNSLLVFNKEELPLFKQENYQVLLQLVMLLLNILETGLWDAKDGLVLLSLQMDLFMESLKDLSTLCLLLVAGMEPINQSLD